MSIKAKLADILANEKLYKYNKNPRKLIPDFCYI